jgi:chaperonin GroES
MSNKTNIIPAPGYLLIKPEKLDRTTESGIVLPDSADNKPQQGKVLSVGADFITDYGTTKTSPVKVDDVVIYKEWGGKEYKQDQVEYLIIKFDDVMATIK